MIGSINIDINADVGEGMDNEESLMPFLSSCNIACGGHTGDLDTMTYIVQLAKRHNVKIGAHPSFPDRQNFGREAMEMAAADLYTCLKRQVRDLIYILRQEHAMLHHIKPHGALYNLAAKHEKTAKVIVEVIKSIALPIKLYAPYNSVIAELAGKSGIEVTLEAFADRSYNNDLSLVSRKKDKAILCRKEEVLNHVLNMIQHQKVKTIRDVEIPIKASTFCVHSDTENALEILQFLNKELPKHHIQIR